MPELVGRAHFTVHRGIAGAWRPSPRFLVEPEGMTMKVFSRLSVLSLVASVLVLWLVFGTHAEAPESTTVLPLSPVSAGVLVAHAIRAGLIQPLPVAPEALPTKALTCSPAPCVLPNVQASEGGMPVNENPISANPKNSLQLLTGGNDYNCPNFLGFYTTSDNGSTWAHKCMDAVSGTVGLSDPGVGYDRNNTAYIIGLDGSPGLPLVVVFEKSTDNGTTWSSPQIAVHPAFSSGIVDKPWLAIDTTATSPYVNTLYISATSFSKDQTQNRISVSHSMDGGTTWRTALVDVLQPAPLVDQFSDLTIGKDGSVYVTWMHCFEKANECAGTQATMYFSKSKDGGNTWSRPAAIASPHLAPDTCPSSSRCFYGTLPNTNER